MMMTMIRDAFPFQNGWIFGKVPNGLWPPAPPSFSESCVANFFWNSWPKYRLFIHFGRGMRPLNLPSFKLIFLASFYKIVNLKISTPVVPTTRDNVFHIHCTEKKSHPMVVVSLYHTTPMVQHNPAHSNDTFCKVHLKLHIHCKYSPMHLFQIINFDQTPVYVMYKNSYWRTPHSWNGLWKTFFLSSSF